MFYDYKIVNEELQVTLKTKIDGFVSAINDCLQTRLGVTIRTHEQHDNDSTFLRSVSQVSKRTFRLTLSFCKTLEK
jgi:hypothetical protein